MDAPRQQTIDVRPGGSAWQVMLAYARLYRLALVGGGLLSLATAATGLALPLVVRELIDGLGSGGADRWLAAADDRTRGG